MSFVIGENVGPYRLIEKLGKGGMATVYKAYHARLDRYVALKALHPAFMENEGFLDRFQREAKVVARLEHPHIVPIYDYSEHEDRPYLVLKYVKGQTLKSYLNGNHLSYREIKRIFQAVSSALVYAHHQGVLHRDIKPSNVLIEEGGQIYLADFGLARIAETSQTTMSAQMMMGTPHYISPEQARGLADLDEGTDIYSLGVMMYELLVGEVPFQADTPFSVIHDHIYTPLPMPREINPALTEQLQRTLLKALAKARKDRYADLEEMVSRFLAALDHQISKRGSENARKLNSLLGKSSPKSRSESTTAPFHPTVQIERDGETPAREKGNNRRGFRIPSLVWWFGLPALVLFCLATAVVSSAADPPGPELITPPTLTQEAARPILVSNNGEIKSLREEVNQNPGDPFLLIELGVELWEMGQRKEAEKFFRQAWEVAENNPESYWRIGNLLGDIDLWTYSAVSYLQLQDHDVGVPPEEIENNLRRSVYYAAFDENSLAVLSRPEIDLDNDLLRCLEARKLIVNGRMELAQTMINRTAEKRPDLPQTQLLLADLHIERENLESAQVVLNQLLGEENLPEWVRREAEKTLSRITG